MNKIKENVFFSEKRNKSLWIDKKSGYWKVINREPRKDDVFSFEKEVDELGVCPPDIKSYNTDLYPLECVFYLTNKCNLSCTYCYSKTNRESNWISFGDDMLKKAIDILFHEEKRKRLNFLFFGGECFLAFKQFKLAVNYINLLNKKFNKVITFSATTNGTIINKDIIAFIKDNNIKINISFDGPSEIQNVQRCGLKKEETYEEVLETINTYKKNNIRFGVISTIGDPDKLEVVFDYFLEKRIANSIKISPLIPEGSAKQYDVGGISGYSKQWGEKNIECIRRLIEYNKTNDFKIKEGNTLSMVSHLVLDHRPDLCLRSPCAAGYGMVEFHPDGSFVTCDKTLYSPELGVVSTLKDMNRTDSILELLDKSPLIKKIRSRVAKKIPKCSDCPFMTHCGGACTLGSYNYYGNFEREDAMCEYRKFMFEELMWLLSEDKNNINYLGIG